MVENNGVESLRWFLALVEPNLITENVIASSTLHGDKEILDVLLDHNKDLCITAELIEKCGWNYDAIEKLLGHAPDVTITPLILLNTISTIEIDTLRDILDKNGPSIITCGTIAALGRGEQSMTHKVELLLKRAGPMKVTETAMKEALKRNSSCDTVKMLLDHGWPVNQNILQEAATSGMPAPFHLLLEAGGQVTPKAIAAGAENFLCGGAMVKLLVSLMDGPLDDDVWVQMMLICAKNTWGNLETLLALLEMKPGLKILEENLVAFTKNEISGNIIMDVILEDNREMEITDAVIESTLRNLNYDETILKLMNRHGSTKIPNELLLGAVRNRRFGDEMTKHVLHRYAAVEKPSSEIIEAVIQNSHSGYEILQMLEARFGHLEFNETHIQIAVGSGSITILSLVLNRCSITEATPSVSWEAAAKGSLAVMKHLLMLDNAAISEEMLIAASENTKCIAANDMLKFLWNLTPHIEVCPELFIKATVHYYMGSAVIEFLFDRVKDAQKCQEILNAVMSSTRIYDDSSYIAILDLILESSFEIQVTDNLVMGVFSTGHGSVVETFLDHKVDIKLSQEMVNKAVELKDYRTLEELVKYGNLRELDLQDAMVMIMDNPSPPWEPGEV